MKEKGWSVNFKAIRINNFTYEALEGRSSPVDLKGREAVEQVLVHLRSTGIRHKSGSN